MFTRLSGTLPVTQGGWTSWELDLPLVQGMTLTMQPGLPQPEDQRGSVPQWLPLLAGKFSAGSTPPVVIFLCVRLVSACLPASGLTYHSQAPHVKLPVEKPVMGRESFVFGQVLLFNALYTFQRKLHGCSRSLPASAGGVCPTQSR